jgi:predicted transcriptional regulator
MTWDFSQEMRTKHTFRLPPDLAGQLADYAARKRVPQALVVETALASHLSPDGADRLEGALSRRLDRMTRQIERLERHTVISNEALALFVRFWLTSTPPLPDTAQAAAQAKGRERYEGFIEALGRRLARGRTLADEITADIDATGLDKTFENQT